MQQLSKMSDKNWFKIESKDQPETEWRPVWRRQKPGRWCRRWTRRGGPTRWIGGTKTSDSFRLDQL